MRIRILGATLSLTDLDPGPDLFVSDLQDVNNFFFLEFLCLILFDVTVTSFFKLKSHK
jgi:hypothetical protein